MAKNQEDGFSDLLKLSEITLKELWDNLSNKKARTNNPRHNLKLYKLCI